MNGNQAGWTYDQTAFTGRLLSKTQSHFIRQPSGALIAQKKTSYDWNDYRYEGTQPHAPTHIGERSFTYDANGNQTGWTHDRNGTRRTITWDEENRIQAVADNGHTMTYKYDHTGERVIKQGPQGETVYVNQFFTIRNREAGTPLISRTNRASARPWTGRRVFVNRTACPATMPWRRIR